MSKIEQLQKLYLSVLEEDYKVWVDDDGDVMFKHPDLGTLFLSLHEDDPEYFALIYPNFMDSKQTLELGVDENALFRLSNAISAEGKAVKLSLGWNESDSTWDASLTIEAFLAAADQLPSRELIAATFGRNMRTIHSARDDLYQRVRDYATDSASHDGTVH